MATTPSTRPERFSSRTATLLTMIGVAVGLGNVWRFPYMMGKFGGGAFLLIYLGFVVAFAVPALVAEWALGRTTRSGPIGAFGDAFGLPGRWFGTVLTLGLLVANSYYLVVIANVVYTGMFSAANGFSEPGAIARFDDGLARGPVQAAVGLGLIALAMVVCHRGLQRGIERLSRAFVPCFGLVVIYLIVSALRLPGAPSALATFLQPDFSALTPTDVFAAMGQAFFSLSLGGTFYVIYGSYLRAEEPLLSSAVVTGAGDVGAALLASLFIVPATLVMGIELDSGPTLIFSTLPRLFGHIPGGRWLGTTFFAALWMVAFLSTLAAFQVLVGGARETLGWSRTRAIVVVGGCEAVLMVPTALNPHWIGTLDLIFGSGLQVLGSGLAVVALTWGLGRTVALREILPSGSRGAQVLFHWLRWGVPAALIVTLALFLADAM